MLRAVSVEWRGGARHSAVPGHVSHRPDDDRRCVPRHDRRRAHQLRQTTPRVRDPDADQTVSVGRVHVPHPSRPPVRRLVQPTADLRRQRKVALSITFTCTLNKLVA